MFSQACVKNSVHGGGCLPHCMLGYTHTHTHTHTPWTHLSPPGHRTRWTHTPLHTHTHPAYPPLPPHCSGRYALYWNAFLFQMKYVQIKNIRQKIQIDQVLTLNYPQYSQGKLVPNTVSILYILTLFQMKICENKEDKKENGN